MRNWPKVMVGVITYNRKDELTRTVTNLRSRLVYPEDKIELVVSDDCSPDGYGQYISNNLHCSFISTAVRGGFGANANNLLHHFEQSNAEYLLFIEDDKFVDRSVDLTIGVALLESTPGIGMLRYKSPAGTTVVLHLLETDIREWLPDYRSGLGQVGVLTYCLLGCSSPSLYIYSNGMHLKRRSFHQFYGYYPEGRKLGVTEEAMCHMVKDGMFEPGAPAIAVLPDWLIEHTEDFGSSYQGRGEDIGNV